uniref:PNPLA domain-containing protein n=1 Tax=Ditylum brightwellii TaxID=49249 RepID=A0A7S4WC17_9STRA
MQFPTAALLFVAFVLLFAPLPPPCNAFTVSKYSKFPFTLSTTTQPTNLEQLFSTFESTNEPNSSSSSSSSFDVILSSGFLCFSQHAGFAASLEDLNLRNRIDRFVGTSSGSLAASMLAAGISAEDVAAELSAKRPIAQCRPSSRFWRGVLSTTSLQNRLRTLLPETFEELEKPLAVGVFDVKTQQTRLVSAGLLIPAVAASCAVSGGMFAPVRLEDGRLYADGGAIDRTFVRKWREWDTCQNGAKATNTDRKALVHLVTSQNDGVYLQRDGIPDEDDRDDIISIVHSPRTEGGLFSLGDFEMEREITRSAVTQVLRQQMTAL